MLKIRKKLSLLIALTALTGLVATGCGSSTGDKAANGDSTSGTGEVVLKVGASPKPHAEILEHIKPELEKEGIKLEIVNFNDYVQPNLSLDKGDIDANFFQHIPYLESFSKEHNLNLVSIAKVHIEPMGVYSKKVTKLDELKKGDTVAIPNDATNAGRALLLLEKAGLLTLKAGVGFEATVQDIATNPKDLKITLLDAAQLPRTLQDVGAAVINTNYALEAGLNPLTDALFLEEKDSPYANVLAVKKDRENDPNLQKLAKALTSPDVKKFIEDTYKDAIIPSF